MLSQATIDAANAEIMRVFDAASVYWRTIPRWNTGDASMTAVQSDAVASVEYGEDIAEPLAATDPVPVASYSQQFKLAYATATADLDGLLAACGAVTRAVCGAFDTKVAPQLVDKATAVKSGSDLPFAASVRLLEGAGYRAARALYADDAWFDKLHEIDGGRPLRDRAQSVLDLSSLDHAAAAKQSVLLGRSGERGQAGDEPVDIAVTVAPSLESIGVNNGDVLLAVRMACALRIKDASALVAWAKPS